MNRDETLAIRGGRVHRRAGTRWGPVIGDYDAGRPLALRWTAHDPRATNLRMLDFETATNVDEALSVANRAGGPVQNVVVADADGRIGWSLMGQVPVRGSYDSTLPHSWREPGGGWTGWRAPDEYPRVVDPASGRLWTANARTIDTQTWLAFMGDGGYDLGARAAQIRDDLLALPTQRRGHGGDSLDDRALFLARWRDCARSARCTCARRAAAACPGSRAVPALVGRAAQTMRAIASCAPCERRSSRMFTNRSRPSRVSGMRRRSSRLRAVRRTVVATVTQRPTHLLDLVTPVEAALVGSLDRALATPAGAVQGAVTLHVGGEQRAAHEASVVIIAAVRESLARHAGAADAGRCADAESAGRGIRRIATTGRVARPRSARFAAIAGRSCRSSAVAVLRCGQRSWVAASRRRLAGRSEEHDHLRPLHSVVGISWSPDVSDLNGTDRYVTPRPELA